MVRAQEMPATFVTVAFSSPVDVLLSCAVVEGDSDEICSDTSSTTTGRALFFDPKSLARKGCMVTLLPAQVTRVSSSPYS